MGVRTDTETNAGSTVGDGAEPCELGLVDGEVRAGGAAQTLLVENFLGGGRRERLGLDGTGNTCSGMRMDRRQSRGSYLPPQRNIAESDCTRQSGFTVDAGLGGVYAPDLGLSAACLRAGPKPRTRVESMAGERGGRGCR